MLFRVHSAAVFGIKAYPVAVEVELSSGDKLALMTVGLPDTAVRESSERVKAALRSSGYFLPAQRIMINLAPADVRKEGSAFDLPMAVGILGAAGRVRTQNLARYLFMGELSLDGSTRPPTKPSRSVSRPATEWILVVSWAPFGSPHHTISNSGLIGGGVMPRPGEVSLAHNGVLFLDELPEFQRHVLDLLHQPLEDGEVTISRAAMTQTFPARFMLAAAINP